MATVAQPYSPVSPLKNDDRYDSAHDGPVTPPSSPPRTPETAEDYPHRQGSRASPVKITYPSVELLEPYAAEIDDGVDTSLVDGESTPVGLSPGRPSMISRSLSIRKVSPDHAGVGLAEAGFAPRTTSSSSPQHISPPKESLPAAMYPPRKESIASANSPPARIVSPLPLHDGSRSGTPMIQLDGLSLEEPVVPEEAPELQYHHRNSPIKNPSANASQSTIATFVTTSSDASTLYSETVNSYHATHRKSPLSQSEDSLNLGADYRGRSLTPQGLHPNHRSVSLSGSRSPDRPVSYIDLLNTPYSQQMAQQNTAIDNTWLRDAVGSNASLLDSRKTLDMYRANIKKTTDPSVQYEFAVFMVNTAQDASSWDDLHSTPPPPTADSSRSGTPIDPRADLLREAKQILQKLADKSYVFAQYYLADGYASGLFSKGKEDYSSAFPLFLSAGKHGHAEAGYRTALCYEFGWGCRRDYAKAVQFFRQAASKNHPGAAVRLGTACLAGDMGLHDKYREGIKWLKRAAESADAQHNSGPYELGLLHTTGFGADVFKDEGYAAQLFTQAAELGHPEACLRMGEAYEHGLLSCPRDPALSIHFYTGAAQAGLPAAMMALCAWYMVGAEPILEKDEEEACEWAKKAAQTGMSFLHFNLARSLLSYGHDGQIILTPTLTDYARAQYAVGYFTEMGIGCRRNPLEANVWYVRAADQGDERAIARLAIIRSAETGDTVQTTSGHPELRKKKSWWKRSKSPTAPA